MSTASGVNKVCVFSKESTWGTKPAANTGEIMRRVTLDLGLTREQFTSAAISGYAQTTSSRSGTDTVEGTYSDELTPGAHDMLWEALLRGPWVNGVTSGALTTVAASSAGNTFTRSAGSWLTGGFKDGDTITVSGFAAPATANNKQYTVLSVTATVLTVAEAVVTKAAGDSVTIAVTGKKLVIPLTVDDRTDDSFTVEQQFSDIGVYRVATGVKVSNASVSVEPDSFATVEFGLLGKDQVSSGTKYFTSPANASTNESLTGNAGAIFANGVQLGLVTSFSFDVDGGMEAGKIVGNLMPDGTRPASAIFLGRVAVTGTMSAYFENDNFYSLFRDETPVSVVFKFKGEGDEFMVFKFPKVKLGGANPDDKEVGGLMQEIGFTALLGDGTDTSLEQSTLVLQVSE